MGWFYMKCLGCILVLSAGTCMGILFSQDMEKRYRELCDLRKSFIIIYADISYGNTSMGEVLGHVKRQAIPLHSKWFERMEVCLRKERSQTFSDVWKNSIEVYLQDSHMSKREKEELISIGETMGNVDKNQQLAMLQLYQKKLNIQIESLETEKDQKQRLYKTLGVLGSVFVVVLLL